MLKGLTRWAGNRVLLRELRGLRSELTSLRQSTERIAAALEAFNAHQWPQQVQPDPLVPSVEITYANDPTIQEFMEIELALTRATGQPPTEDQVVAEFERRHTGEGGIGDEGRSM